MQYTHLKFTVEDRIALITLNRPDHRNAFTPEMLESWLDALTRCEQRADVSVIILTGEGSSFCAGGDVKHFLSGNPDSWEMKNFLQHKVHPVALALHRLDRPTIAALNGPAHGARLDMALLCDIRIASDRAQFSESYIRLGLAPGDGGAYLLPRIVGKAKAMEWLLTGNLIEVNEAFRYGLVNKVVPHAQLMSEAYAMARAITRNSPTGVRVTKRAVQQGVNSDLSHHLDYISSQMGLLCHTDDFKQAVRDFLKEHRTRNTHDP